MSGRTLAEGGAIVERYWAVENSAGASDDPTVLAAANEAIAVLQGVLDAIGSAGYAVELGRTWRYLGEAWHARSAGHDGVALHRSRGAYLPSEQYLTQKLDSPEWAKPQFNSANTTRLLEGRRNSALMKEAKERFNRARATFASAMPSAVPQVDRALELLEIATRTRGLFERPKIRRSALDESRELGAILSAMAHLLDQIRRDEWNTGRTTTDIEGLLEPVGPVLADSPEAEELMRKSRDLLEELHGAQRDAAPSSNADDALFEMAVGASAEAPAKGEASSERQTALLRVLEEFRSLSSLPASTPKEIAIKSRRMEQLLPRSRTLNVEPEIGHD